MHMVAKRQKIVLLVLSVALSTKSLILSKDGGEAYQQSNPGRPCIIYGRPCIISVTGTSDR